MFLSLGHFLFLGWQYYKKNYKKRELLNTRELTKVIAL